ncbi:quinol:cytochrome C oxidoreductase [Wenyingzhuangia fucanilytica]|uniref:Quinol:cytochrome C oxidoreductase n=1 Tax=Wenyingzhuangia fucanilytica TaxID=1790137 RepID=A0A1B1Y6Y7_9FLAO|nr:quinol:cytochrome C oxidoreductase [Wenyingzhuangia fucanilytica]ANW96525.1 quinol:cytochrome C oxidoreductase [Wenyingzhuangia fucanilytica]
MYQFSSKLKITAIALMVIGLIGIIISFASAPSTEAEAAEILAHQTDAHGAHGGDAHATKEISHDEHHEHADKDAHHADTTHDAHADHHAEEGHDAGHLAHVLHQLQNRPWAAFYVALFFFTFVTVVVFAFLNIQRVAQAGWSIVLFRVMEGISGFLPYVSVIFLGFLIITALHGNHLFVWMAEGTVDPSSPNFDPIIANKSGWLNVPRWLICSIIYLVGWNVFVYLNRKHSVLQDNASDLKNYYKNYKFGVAFLAFFIFTESMSVWDWIMGLDPHWFSTLFGWYVFATAVVSALTVIAMVTVYLKSKGYLEIVNNSHLHDLAKFMFGFSIFWTYLWFAQFMLIWYADMPEETTYFVQRFDEYKLLFLGMIPLNFILPVLMLVNSDFKRIPQIVLGTGTIILIGHYIDVFVMIMPATVGDQWGFGWGEVGSVLFFLGLFIYAVFTTISKAPLIAKGNPFLHESEHFHY